MAADRGRDSGKAANDKGVDWEAATDLGLNTGEASAILDMGKREAADAADRDDGLGETAVDKGTERGKVADLGLNLGGATTGKGAG